MVGNRFAVLAILPGLHTSFPWAALAKAYKQLWKGFVVTILCAVYVAGAFGSRSPLTTMQVMSTLSSKHLQEYARNECRDRNRGYVANYPAAHYTLTAYPHQTPESHSPPPAHPHETPGGTSSWPGQPTLCWSSPGRRIPARADCGSLLTGRGRRQ